MPDLQPLNCPSCRSTMERKNLARKLSGTVDLDLCVACRGIWFDKYENLQLEASSVVELFVFINDHAHDQYQPLGDAMPCPRCGDHLIHSMDRAKSGAFNYLRCIHDHGHFIVFSQFMIEKGFVRQMNGAEIEKLKAEIGEIRCMGCGGPVDIRKDSACPYCHAPIALLDPAAVQSALAAYQQAADQKNHPPDPNLLADTIINKQRELTQSQKREQVHDDLGDLLIEGVVQAWRLVHRG